MSKRAVSVRVEIHSDIREMESAEKALQASYHSLSQHLRAHRACRDEPLAPNHGGILSAMFAKGQLTEPQLKGWKRFWDDLRKERESSNAMVGSLTGGSSGGSYSSRELQKARPGPSTRLTEGGARARWVAQSLHFHERGLLEQLIRDTLRTEGYKEIHAHSLSSLGGLLAGYRDNRQCNAAAVSAIQRLLSSIAEKYGVQQFQSA